MTKQLFMQNLPMFWVAALLVLAAVISVCTATLWVQRTTWFEGLKKSSDFLGVMYPMIGAIYGVVLAFTIVLSWQRFAEAETYTSAEVTHLSSIWRNVTTFECSDHRRNIEQALLDYAQSVVECEWKSLASGEDHAYARANYKRIWNDYASYQPKELNFTEQQFYSAGLDQLNELGIQRRLRLMSADSQISLSVWVFLCVGGVITVFMPVFVWTGHNALHIIVNGIMASIVAFSLWIVASLQFPYAGQVSVSTEPFDLLLSSFDRRIKDSKCSIELRPRTQRLESENACDDE